MKHPFWANLSIALLLFCKANSIDSEKVIKTDLFLQLDPVKYLTGNFNPKTHLVQLKETENAKEHYLRLEVQKALNDMIEAYELEKPKGNRQTVFLVSTFRSFSDQKSIWESKYTGKKVMREPIKGKTPQEIIDLILEFSSAPGTSRHHWGTDFDINSLENQYFEGKGRGSDLYSWLQKNASRFGFCQPYNELGNRNMLGYHEEKWHWSFAPVAVPLQEAWIRMYKEKQISLSDKFLGGQILGDRVLDFVQSTNKSCVDIAKEFPLQPFSQ